MRLVACLLAAVLGSAAPLQQADAQEALRVLSSNGVKAVVESLQADIERTLGRRLDIEFSTAASLTTDIEAGAAFDVAILTPALIARLVEQNKIAAASRIDFARAGVGVGARPGTGQRDVSTLDALEETLLAADSVAYTGDGQSRRTIDAAFVRLGIAETMAAKTTLLGPGEAPEAVAAGEAELVLTLVSEILPVPGLELIGPLPAEVQGYVAFAAGRSPMARDVAAADALLAYLGGAKLAAALAAHGMESTAN